MGQFDQILPISGSKGCSAFCEKTLCVSGEHQFWQSSNTRSKGPETVENASLLAAIRTHA